MEEINQNNEPSGSNNWRKMEKFPLTTTLNTLPVFLSNKQNIN